MEAPPLLDVLNVTKTYETQSQSLTVVDNISFRMVEGETCAIVGPSGSGKTTLLGLCAGLDRPTSGSVIFQGTRLNDLDEDELAELRAHSVGFVFQTFQLIPTLTALENVMVPIEIQGGRQAAIRARRLLEQVGLHERLQHYPAQLSGGEQQRVALARAFINQPKILFADEPTGNLDEETSQTIIPLLFDLNRKAGTTLILVTHDLELAQQTQRVIRLKGGSIVSDTGLHDQSCAV